MRCRPPRATRPRSPASARRGRIRRQGPAARPAWVATTRGPSRRRSAVEGPDDAVDVLVGHRRHDQCQAATRGRRRRRSRVGRRSSRATASAAAPAGLWAPSRRTSRSQRPRMQLQAARPGRGRVAASPRVVGGARDARLGERIEDARLRPPRWRPGAAPGGRPRVRPRRGSSTSMPSRSQPRRGAGRHLRRARRCAGRAAGMTASAVAARARHGQVAALDDGGLLAGDERDRGPRRSMWSRADVRDRGHAPVPGMRGVEASAEPDLDERDVERPRRRTT